MGRSLLYIILIGVGLALLRWLIMDVVRAVRKALSATVSGDAASQKAGARAEGQSADSVGGHLVRDPFSGTYIDERLAIKDVINGETLFFESKENRDAYVKQARTG